MLDRVTYTQNRQVMPRNCSRVRPPAKRRVEISVIPIMVASLAQLRLVAEPTAPLRDEPVSRRDDLDADPQTRMARGASHKRVIQHRYQRRTS